MTKKQYTEVRACRLKKDEDRLWFEYQVPGQDFVTNVWNGGNDKVKVQCDLKSSSREYDPDEKVKIHPRKRKKVKE